MSVSVKYARYVLHEFESRLSMWLMSWIDRSAPLLLSHPKSGRTWIKFMLARYAMLHTGDPHVLDLHYMNRVFPNLTFALYGRRVLRGGRFRLLASHCTGSRLRVFERILLVVRDPRDVLVSYYYHQKARGAYTGELDAFILDSPYGLRSLIPHARFWNGFRAHARNVHIVHYEDVKKEPHRRMRDIIAFLGWPLDDALLEESIRYGSFDNMRSLETRGGNRDISPAMRERLGDQARFVRKGSPGAYREELSRECIDKVESRLRRALPGWFGYL
jgi:alcohol sulfotransferase